MGAASAAFLKLKKCEKPSKCSKNATHFEVSGVILNFFKITYEVFQESSTFTT